jgi:tetratricopeptide (TPR) repeat protein
MRTSVRLLAAAALLGVAMGTPSALAGTATSSGDSPDELVARGIHLHQAGDLMGAIQNYEIALETAPERADIRSNLGAAFVALGRFDEAIKQYGLALTTREDPAIRLNLAVALYKATRHDAAIPEFQRVLQADPQNKQAALLLADCLLQGGRNKEVIDLLEPRDAAFSDDLAYAYILGTALLEEGELARGQVVIDRIFKNGESAEGHLLMGLAYLNKQEYQNAVTELARSIELNPTLNGVHVLYGRALLGTSQRDRALRVFRTALEQEPDDFDANLQLGNMYRVDQKFEQAMTYLKRAAAIRPTDASLRHVMAATHLGLGQAEQALQLLEPLVQDAPNFLDGHVLLATTYYRLKRKEDGDRERAIVARLTEELQAKQPGAQPPTDAGPASALPSDSRPQD